MSVHVFRFLVLSGCIILLGCSEPDLRQTAIEVDRKCPLMVDSETRLDRVFTEGENVLVYQFTLVNVHVMNVDTALFRKQVTPGLLANLRVSPELGKLRDMDAIVVYNYMDRHGNPIQTLRFGPRDYRGD